MKSRNISLLILLSLAAAASSALWGITASALNPRDGVIASPMTSVVTGPALDGFDPNANNLVRAVAVQSDGKILIGGDFTALAPNGGPTVVRNYIARLNPDGTLDAGFNPNANFSVNAIAVQPDGKILIGGDFSALAPNGGAGVLRNRIARLNADGTVDTTFNPGANTSVYAIALQADGRILIGGQFTSLAPNGGATVTRYLVARLNADGTVDASFDPNLINDNRVVAIAVQSDGKILIGGLFTTLAPNGGPTVTRNNIARLNPDGTVDAAFDPNANSVINAIAIQADGKILIGGAFNTLTPNGVAAYNRNYVARLNTNGTVDMAFNPNPNGSVRAIAVQPDGKILIGGGFTAFGGLARNCIARLNTDGTIEVAFIPSPNSDVYAIALQADGKILAGGSFSGANGMRGQIRNRIARLEADGRLDQTLNLSAIGSVVSTMAVQPDGKILIAGSFTSVSGVARNNIARLNADGTVDTSFNPGANDVIYAIAVEPDGKILIGGSFAGPGSVGGQARNYIARLNADGTVDASFDPRANQVVDAIAVQADGKILICGQFTTLAPNGGGSVARNYMARLNADGTVDTSFDPGPNNTVLAMAVEPDGKILIGGSFNKLAPNGGATVTRNCIARLNTNGTLDMSFDPKASAAVYAIAIQADGKIIVGGSFDELAPNGGAGVSRNNFARLNVDGTVDADFDPNPNSIITTIAVQADGRILVGGSFRGPGSIGGQTRDYIARLNADGTVDSSFDPDPDNYVAAIATQADGKILAGGFFNTMGGQARHLFARLTNNAAIQNLSATRTAVTWRRSGAASQFSRVTFERSTDGVNYSFLGNGTRVGASNDFTLSGQNLQTEQNLYIRARGFYRGGYQTGSESVTESVRNIFLPPQLHLVFGQQPTNASAGSAITPAVTVQILDASNNLVNTTASVTIGINSNPSSGTLSGTTTVAAVNGTATFSNLSINKVGAGYSLTASGADLTGATSSPFNITAGAPSSISATAGSGQSATINSTFAAPLRATVTDAGGNPLSGVTVTFTAPASGASGTFANNTTTTTATTDANGVATASAFKANSTAGAYNVAASINGVASLTAFALTNNKGNQNIAIRTHAPTSAAYNTQFTVAATTSSGLGVLYGSSGACTNSGATFTMTSGAGTCTVIYDQPGDGNYNAAARQTEAVTAQKADQAISFGALANRIYGDAPFKVSATGGASGNAVSFSSQTPAVCSLAGDALTILAAGRCTVRASQAGNSNFNSAADVDQSFDVGRAATSTALTSSANPSDLGQTVTFTAKVASTAGAPSGAVRFIIDGKAQGTPQALDSLGAASMSVSGLTAANHTVAAEYDGDANFASSTGALAEGQTVNAATSVSVNDVSLTEGDGQTKSFDFTVTLSAASNRVVKVDFATADGTAAAGTDYVAASGTLSFAPGDVSEVISVAVNGNTKAEADKTFFVNLSNPQNASIGDSQGLGTILNDDAEGGVIEFSQSNYIINENARSIVITVNRTNDTSKPATVDYSTSDQFGLAPCSTVNGQASNRCDYLLATGTLNFAAGEKTKTFRVFITDDTYQEGTEQFSLTLSNATGGALLGNQSAATVTITDDPNPRQGDPIDAADYFIREQYVDFLYREPDALGFKNWLDTISNCPNTGFGLNSPQCDRVHVAESFYQAEEFAERGYLIFRFYNAVLGRRPSYREFMQGLQMIGGGQSPAESEANKQAFVASFIDSQEFHALYDQFQTGDELVNALIQRSGVTPAVRLTLINNYAGAGRAATVRAFIETKEVSDAFFDRGFVTMLYFGFLRREPDPVGFNNYLQKLRQTGDPRPMVFDFIYSDEYRARFGAP